VAQVDHVVQKSGIDVNTERVLTMLRTPTVKVNGWGVFSIVLSVGALVTSRLLRRSVRESLYLLLQVCALVFSVIAARRGNKNWLVLGAAYALLIIQAAIALVVE
jgi:hypothetical protein